MEVRVVEANWTRKVELLKACSDADANLREIAGRFNVSRGTVYYTLNEFTNIYRLTEEESDFPRKLLKYYNINLDEGVQQLAETDIRSLRHYVDKAKKKEMGEDEMDSLPRDYSNNTNNNYHATSIGMSAGSTEQQRFDVTTEEGLLRAILYKAKNVNPGAIERFIEAYDLNKKHFTVNPQALQQLMMHTFGPGYGSDAFQMFMSSRGQYVADTGVAQNNGGGMGGINPMMLMMMMGGAGNMAQMLPLLMQNGGAIPGMGGGGGAMNDMMGMMMMQEFKKQNEKKEQQDQFDKIMNIMMLKMIGGTMDSRNMMDANSGNFMVQEILDKDKNVKERQLLPMATVLSNPMMMGSFFKPGGAQDETTQAVLRNALEEKSKMMELYMTNNQPMLQVLMTLLGNFQNKNDPIAQFGQLMEIRDKYMGGQGNQVDPEIEKMKIDLQLAMHQQNFTLEQMKHTWEMEKEEKKAGSENVKSWMSMIGQVGEKLAAPAMALVAGGMGQGNKAGLLNAGQNPAGPAGLPPLGSGPQIVKPGDITKPAAAQQRPEGIQFGVPDPSHADHLFPDPQPQQSHGGEMDPTVMMLLAKQQEKDQQLNALMAEVHRLRTVMIQDQNQQQNQRTPVLTRKQLDQMSVEQIQEVLESIKDNEKDAEKTRMDLETELSQREWLMTPAPEVSELESKPKKKEEEEQVDPAIVEALEQEQIDELPVIEPEEQEEEDTTSNSNSS